MTDHQRRIYDQFELSSGAWLDEDDEEAGFVFSQFGITKVARLREIALGNPVMVETDEGKWTTTFRPDTKSAKLDKLIEILEDPEHINEPFVVYTHSKKFIQVVVERLNARGIKAVAFTGDLNYAKKRKAIAGLGEDYRVMVATQASIGTGTDGLQHKCSRMVVLSRDVKMIVNEQAKERLYRPGQKEHIQLWEIVAANSNDLDTNLNLDYAQEQIATMLDANTLGEGE